jgi:hypothetical protein
MKKILALGIFLFVITGAWCQSLCFFPVISLDMNKEAVIKILDANFKGKYAMDKSGAYVVTVNNDKKVFISVYNEKIYTLRVVIHNAVYSQFVNCSNEIMGKRGEPDTCRPNGFEYRVEWYGKGSDPGWGLVFSDEAPYTLEELLTYEK